MKKHFPIIAASIVLIIAVSLVINTENTPANTYAQGDICNGRYGDGLNAQFWTSSNFSGAEINLSTFNSDCASQGWGPSLSNPMTVPVLDRMYCFGPDFYSARFTGQIEAPRTGTFTFYLTNTDDVATLRINNQAVLSDVTGSSSGTIDLVENKRYDFQLDYDDRGSGMKRLKLEWSGPNLNQDSISQCVLFTQATACSDGINNDGNEDTFQDFPDDPGCSTGGDTTEENCGNGTIETTATTGISSSEQCDGSNLNDNDCSYAGVGYTGTLSCNANCTFNTAGCQAPVIPQCRDGIDNDGDGAIDLSDASCQNNPEKNDETNPMQCADGVDNDNDGDIDTADTGCTPGAANTDNNESDDPQCSDGLNNDSDIWTDLDDPGCDGLYDNDESNNPQCADGIDNDNDGRIDYPDDDRGCDSLRDNDETNPPISRDIDTRATTGRSSAPNARQYPLSILAHKVNDFFTRVRIGGRFENVPLTSITPFPFEGIYVDPNQTYPPGSLPAGWQDGHKPLINGEVYYHALSGQDSTGERRVVVTQGRYWDLETLDHPDHTPDALLNFFAASGNVNSCAAAMQSMPGKSFFFKDSGYFQILLDMLTICLHKDDLENLPSSQELQ